MAGCHVDAVSVSDAVAYAGHTDGILSRHRQVVEPGTEVGHQLLVVAEPLAESEPVVARRIYMHGAFVARRAHGPVVFQSVCHKGHQAVIVGRDDECGRGQVAAHRILGGKLAHQLLVLLAFAAQEVAAGVLVRHPFVHRDDGIEQDTEVGPHVELRVSGDDRGQVSPGREAHDAHIARMDAPKRGRVAHRAHGLLHIAHGQRAVPFGQTVVHYKVADAPTVHPFRRLVALVGVGQHGVSAPGHSHNGSSRGVFGQVAYHVGLSVGGQIQGEFSRSLCLCRRYGEPQSKK